MDPSPGNKHYNAADIQRYHAGQMPATEMHALEKAAQNDPFLADALEGYRLTNTPREDLQKIQFQLDKKLQQISKSIPLYRRTPWLRVAAILLLMAGSVALMVQQLSKGKDSIAYTKVISTPIKNDSEAVPKMLSNGYQTADSIGTVSVTHDEIAGNTQNSSRTESVSNTPPIQSPQKKSSQKQQEGEHETGIAQHVPSRNAQDTIEHHASALSKSIPSTSISNSSTQPERDNAIKRKNMTAPLPYPERTLQGKVAGVGIDTVTKKVDPSAQTMDEEVVGTGSNKPTAPKKRLVPDTLEPEEGWVKFNQYVASHLKLPDEVKRKNISGEVHLSFEVDRKGRPIHIKVAQPLCAPCEHEAIRILKEGPKWKLNNKSGIVIIKF